MFSLSREAAMSGRSAVCSGRCSRRYFVISIITRGMSPRTLHRRPGSLQRASLPSSRGQPRTFGPCYSPSHDVAKLAVEGLSAAQAIETLVEVLIPDEEEVILLRVADMAVEEVARVMGRNIGTIRVLRHRALRNLAKQFDQEL